MPFVEDLSKLPSSVIGIYMLAMFLGFGVIANFINGGGLLYNLGQGAFISVVTGGLLWFTRYLSRRRTANKAQMQALNPKEVPI